MVTVLVPTPFRKYADGLERLEVEGTNLRQVFENVGKIYPELRDHVVEDDRVRPGLALAVDDFYCEDGLLDKVPEGGTVHILPAMSGG